jgi:hypothetical protein
MYYFIYFKSDKTYVIDKSTRFPVVDELTRKLRVKWGTKWFDGKIICRGSKELCEQKARNLDDAVDLRTTDESSNENEIPRSKKASVLSPASRSQKENRVKSTSANNTPTMAVSQRDKFKSLLEKNGHFSASKGNSRISVDK